MADYQAKQAAYDKLRLPAGVDSGLVDTSDSPPDYVGDWVEILTGPAAGMVGLIDSYEPTTGTLEFDSARGLHPTDPTALIGAGAMYRIVEQNPTRTVVLEIEDSDGPQGDDGTNSDTFYVTVDSDGGDEPEKYTFQWDPGIPLTEDRMAAGMPLVVKFELAPSNEFSSRVVASNVAVSGLLGELEATGREPMDPNYWVGHSVRIGLPDGTPAQDNDRRYLITAYNGTNVTILPTEGSPTLTTPEMDAGKEFLLEVLQVPGFDDQTVRFTYGIFSRTVTTDRIGPIISNMEPDAGAVVAAGTVVLEADIFDVSSGFTTKVERHGEALS